MPKEGLCTMSLSWNDVVPTGKTNPGSVSSNQQQQRKREIHPTKNIDQDVGPINHKSGSLPASS